MNTTRVLALLPLFVVLAHSFSWDIVEGTGKRLKFYKNGILTHTENNPSSKAIYSVAYDPVHSRVLFVDHHNTNMSISSFNLTTRKIKSLVMRITNNVTSSLAYDPLTQLVFWTEAKQIYSISLNPASSNKAVEGNLLVTSDDYCTAIAVDSCGGYIYWAYKTIERAAFDGSEREVLIYKNEDIFAIRSLVIDQQTKKMYWTVEILRGGIFVHIESADLNGKNNKTLYSMRDLWATGLTVSKDFIYWRSYDQRAVLQLPKHQQHGVAPIVYSDSNTLCMDYNLLAANYTIEEQTLGMKSCEALKSLLRNSSVNHSSDISLNDSTCHNYCLQGNCSVSAEGRPKCSCNRGYSGERCEVEACHKHCLNDGVCSLNEAEKPVCQCTADYQGERCDVSICKDYCMHGNCSVSTNGQPTCSCDTGYSGERCEVNACHKHCLNGGDCYLNEEDEPVCQCTADYDGERCNVVTIHTGAHADDLTQQILRDLRSEVKQVIREELQCTLQLYSDKLDENAAKIQKCEKSMKDDQQNHDNTTSKTQTSNM